MKLIELIEVIVQEILIRDGLGVITQEVQLQVLVWHAREFGWSKAFYHLVYKYFRQYCMEYSSIWVPPGGTWVLWVIVEYLSTWVLCLSLDTKLQLLKEHCRLKITKVLKIEGSRQLTSALCVSQILKNVHRSMQPELILHTKDTGHFNSRFDV